MLNATHANHSHQDVSAWTIVPGPLANVVKDCRIDEPDRLVVSQRTRDAGAWPKCDQRLVVVVVSQVAGDDVSDELVTNKHARPNRGVRGRKCGTVQGVHLYAPCRAAASTLPQEVQEGVQ